MRLVIRGTIKLFTWITVVLVLATLAQSWHPALDSLSHFRLHLIAILLALTVCLMLMKAWRWSVIGLVTSLAALALTAPYLPSMKRGFALEAFTNDWNEVRVVQHNVGFFNTDHDALFATLNDANADILIMQEVSPRQKPLIARLTARFPHQHVCQRGGAALLSRTPFAETPTCCPAPLRAIRASVSVGEARLTVAGQHGSWPWPFTQHQKIPATKECLAGLKPPFVVAGDFNAAPWSDSVQQLAHAFDATVVPGVKLTWAPRTINPINRNAWPLLPIDQIMHSREMGVLQRDVLAASGSDHSAVLTVLRWP
ncbi:MAG: endonuclease/exonuclease/phosphatase family protein [Pseudomonadota bacterium]